MAFLLRLGTLSVCLCSLGAQTGPRTSAVQARTTKQLGLKVDSLLSRYVELDKYIFEANLTRITPVPGVFEAIDFATTGKKLDAISVELGETIRQIEANQTGPRTDPSAAFLSALDVYSLKLKAAIEKLRNICARLAAYAKTMSGYNLQEYESDVKLYEQLVEAYLANGDQLTSAFKRLN